MKTNKMPTTVKGNPEETGPKGTNFSLRVKMADQKQLTAALKFLNTHNYSYTLSRS
ncbi:MAG: hypothetical protein PHQ43_13260 [Dehalococcoidales bacterium]|nr:hypothetical protein [Dehalococcoidales bacterium]